MATKVWAPDWFVSKVFSDAQQQEDRAIQFAGMFVQRLRDEEKFDAFFDVHSRTEPGWWPMKIPFKSRDTKIHQLRYLTPELLDLLTHPEYAPQKGSWAYRREHVITRDVLVNHWRELGTEAVDAIADHMYLHRWSVVGVTVGQAAAIAAAEPSTGASGHARYVAAGITDVYDRTAGTARTIESIIPPDVGGPNAG